MKKILDLYRQYGLSPAKLRDLAIEMEKVGRAEKRKESGNTWSDETSGKEIWYLDENAVIEYLAGQLTPNFSSKKNKSAQIIDELQEEIVQLHNRESTLLQECDRLMRQLEFARGFSLAWKTKAKQLQQLLKESHQNKSCLTKQFSISWKYSSFITYSVKFLQKTCLLLQTKYWIFYQKVESLATYLSDTLLTIFFYIFSGFSIFFKKSQTAYNYTLSWSDAIAFYFAVIIVCFVRNCVAYLKDSLYFTGLGIWLWLNWAYRCYYYSVEHLQNKTEIFSDWSIQQSISLFQRIKSKIFKT